MPFPTSDREVYENNPLNEVICQIRYPAILRVAAETPSDFQEAIRDKYPMYEEKIPSLSLGLACRRKCQKALRTYLQGFLSLHLQGHERIIFPQIVGAGRFL